MELGTEGRPLAVEGLLSWLTVDMAGNGGVSLSEGCWQLEGCWVG